MIPDLTDAGLLPVGRFQCTMDEVQRRFVSDEEFGTSTTRADIWAKFQVLVARAKNEKAKIPSAFVSGTFVTSKIDPSDIDASLLVDSSRVTNDQTRGRIQTAIEVAGDQFKLDVFPIWWSPEPVDGGSLALTNEANVYLRDRGLWDDLWQRNVAKAERRPFQRHHAFPQRGYLEVMIDGYR